MRRKSRIACQVAVVMVLVALGSCAKAPPEPRDVNTNYDNYSALVAGIGRATKVVLYEGLPHQWSEEPAFQQEIRKPHVVLHEYPFYTELLELKPEDAYELVQTVTNVANFTPWAGYKKCGGYHPDYALEWHTTDGVYRCLVCLGCYEVKVFGPQSELYCDMTPETKQRLKALFKPYRKNRPKSQID